MSRVLLKTAFPTAALIITLAISTAASGKTPPKPAAPLVAQPTAKLVALGRAQFLLTCAACHGANAEDEDGPSLRHLTLSDSSVAFNIMHGFKDEMPAFTSLTPAQVSGLEAYIRSLR